MARPTAKATLGSHSAITAKLASSSVIDRASS
jgi:hypothetical protein